MKTSGLRGFTLVEVLIVVAVIGFLAVIGIPYILNAYNHSQTQTKARNITEVEKAKLILTLPETLPVAGAMGLEDTELMIDGNTKALSNLCAALRIRNITEIEVDGDSIVVGSLSKKASY